MLLRETAEKRRRPAVVSKRKHNRDPEEAVLLKALFTRHPAILHFRENLGLPLVHLRPEELGPADGSRSQLPSLSASKFGAALAFWRRKRIQGLLLLHRTGPERDFSEAELKALRGLHPHLQTALCRVIALRRQQAQKQLLADILKPLPLPLVLCDWRLRVVCETAAGLEARFAWEVGEERARLFNASGRHPLPTDLADFCRSHMRAWENAHPARRAELEKEEHELEHPRSPRCRAKVQMVRQRKFALIRPLILLQFNRRAADGNGANGAPIVADNFATLAPLSACERELALLVSEGHSNAEISRRLGKSLHTIKAQLHSIFEKLGVKSRSKLIALFIRTSLHLLPCLAPELIDALLPIS